MSTFAKLPVHVVFMPGNHGWLLINDFRPRRKSTVGALRGTIWSVPRVTSKTTSYVVAHQGALTCNISRLFHVEGTKALQHE